MSQASSSLSKLRSRKSRMVPRATAASESEIMERQREEMEMMEQSWRNQSSFSTSSSSVPDPLDEVDSEVASDIRTLIDPGFSVRNGHATEIGAQEASNRSTDADSAGSEEDGISDSDRQPLLSAARAAPDDVEVEGPDAVVVLQQLEENETSLAIMLQVLFPYIIAGFGTVGAGMVLDVVQHSPVFSNVTELFILVPALLGLKGNLEMTLASRLSTQANLGNMDSRREKFKMIGGNMALVQAQATVVGFLASMFAMIMGWIPKGEFPLEHALLLCASSMFTAAVASFVLGSLMVGVVLLSRRVNINPDNVATPIAASLGDLTTLALLAGVSSLLYSAIGKQEWLSPCIMGLFFLLLPLWIIIAVKNPYTNDVIYSGWTPVLSAMVISSLGGVILDAAVTAYHGIAVFQPVINGVGGNLVAVQASRISTYLHRRGRPGEMPPGISKGCANPFTFFFGSSVNSRAARVLLLLVVPGHLIFIYTIYYMKAGHTSITILFNVFYLLAALMQVILLLYISQWMVHFIWRKGEDPDNVAIPYLTAIGDLLGTGFLALAFHLLYLIGDRDADLGE
ncbi:hypothetical protein BaRGS_00008751 [Batillaria attramentaria]|uniref:SLC41A/MgtE integral membrane domain-containing protein n=1 Tax=Batillaria attramentaria TaxID=370345 RepID=A0ABD0LL58_9CAEN